MNSEIALGNYLVDLYFGSFDIPDGDEHLYYKLTFMTADHQPIASTMMSEWAFNNLLDNMEYLPENCGFGFDFQPAEPFVNYTIWMWLESETEDVDVQNIFTTDQVNLNTQSAKESSVRIALYKQKYGQIEQSLIDTYLTFDEYYNLWKKMSGCWWGN